MTYASEITAILLNVVLTCIIVCGGICAGIEYSLKRSPGYLAVMAIFLSYIIDNSIVFCTEMIPAFAEVYDRLFLETPSLKTLVFIVRISSILFLLSRTMREFTITRVLILSAIHASLLILVPIIKEYNLMVFFYYFPSQFVVICVSLWALSVLKRNPDRYDNAAGVHIRRIMLYFLISTVFVLIEDSFVIFYVDVYTGPGLKIFNRNFSENLQMCGLSLLFVRYFFRRIMEMQCRVQEMEEEIAAHANSPARMDPIREFSLRHGLTDREMDIFRCLLEEKSQQEISDTLVIALGTVKTHTHNIYRKTDTANRNQIIVRYQQFLDERD